MMEIKLFNRGNQSDDLMSSSGSPQQRVFYILGNLSEKDIGGVFNMSSRICKIIMKKLSATHDTEFRGRV